MSKSFYLLIIGLLNCLISSGQTIEIDGLNREYIFYKPLDIQPEAPLVFVFHGYSGSAIGIKNYSKMNLLAEEYGFAVCYPKGTKDKWGNSFWQVGYSFHDDNEVDDVKFVKELASRLQREHGLSAEKTFSTGMSNGGDMSYYLACEAPEFFAAVAPVAGCIMQWYYYECDNQVKMPVFAIHGTNDDITWWSGDINDTQGYGPYLGVRDAISFWKRKNMTTTEVISNLPNKDISDGSSVISHKYGGNEKFDVWLYEITNGGHDWPGSSGNKDINASLEIWNFFSYVIGEEIITESRIDNNINGQMLSAFPNPFNGQINISIDTDVAENINVVVYGINGKLIKPLFQGVINSGPANLNWDATDSNGAKVGNGTYIIKVKAGQFETTYQIVYLN